MKTKVILIIVLISILVLVLLSSQKCEKWTQNLSAPDSLMGDCYDSLSSCNSGCTGYRCIDNCSPGPVCGTGDNCYGSQQNCLDSCTGYICSTSASGCTTGAKCTSTGIGSTCWTNCPSSMCVGYRYLNGQCTAGAKCSAIEANCSLTEVACKESNIRYKSLGSRCFNYGYNCLGTLKVGSPVKYTFSPTSNSGSLVKVEGDNLTVYGTIVAIDNTENTAKIMPDVIQSNGPSSSGFAGSTYYWGRNTWYTKKQGVPYGQQYFGTYATPISNSILPNDLQLAKLANAPLGDLTVANIPDVLL